MSLCFVAYKAAAMPVLTAEKIRVLGMADPYSLSNRCNPQAVLLYVIMFFNDQRAAG